MEVEGQVGGIEDFIATVIILVLKVTYLNVTTFHNVTAEFPVTKVIPLT